MHFRGILLASAMVPSGNLCHAPIMRCSPATKSTGWLALMAALVTSSCLGGQSGGETGEVNARDPAACACISTAARPVHARVTAFEGGCAELEVLEVLVAPEPDEYMPLGVGDTFGGVINLMCQGSPEIATGDEVLALFERGSQTSSTCAEYTACSKERCGSPDAAYTTSIDPECKAQQEQNAAVDCPPIEEVNEDVLVAYDQCDSQCLEETREVCATHALDEQLGGRVSVAKWVDDEVQFHWASQLRQESFEQLASPDCSERHRELWDARPRSKSSGNTTAQAPVDGAETPVVVCPYTPNP